MSAAHDPYPLYLHFISLQEQKEEGMIALQAARLQHVMTLLEAQRQAANLKELYYQAARQLSKVPRTAGHIQRDFSQQIRQLRVDISRREQQKKAILRLTTLDVQAAVRLDGVGLQFPAIKATKIRNLLEAVWNWAYWFEDSIDGFPLDRAYALHTVVSKTAYEVAYLLGVESALEV